MKIIGVSCSPRKGKTTSYLLKRSLDFIKENYKDIETELIDLGGLKISGCIACGNCKTQLDCSIKDDFVNLIPKLDNREIKGLIIATPVYLCSMTSQCKAFIDRTVMFRRNGYKFKNIVGGVLAVGGVRNGGQEITIQAVQSAMLCHDMIVVGDGIDTSHIGGIAWSDIDGGIEKDDIGIKTACNLGKRVAELVLKLK